MMLPVSVPPPAITQARAVRTHRTPSQAHAQQNHRRPSTAIGTAVLTACGRPESSRSGERGATHGGMLRDGVGHTSRSLRPGAVLTLSVDGVRRLLWLQRAGERLCVRCIDPVLSSNTAERSGNLTARSGHRRLRH